MELHGYPVNAGDRVFDVLYGDGTVVNITPDNMAVVKFGARAFTFDDRGVGHNGRRTLYWHDPVLVVPAKDNDTWAFQRGLMATIYDYLRPGARG